MQVAHAFKTSRTCLSGEVFIAFVSDALVSPKGLVFTKEGRLIYESLFPWQVENFLQQFSDDLLVEGDTVRPNVREDADIQPVDEVKFVREGGEVGFFHFVNSILPRAALVSRLKSSDRTPFIVSTRERFAKDIISEVGISTLEPINRWYRVRNLVFPSPMTFQGDHFTRPRYAAKLLEEIVLRFCPDWSATSSRQGRRVYLSRDDARVRRLVNEDDVRRTFIRHGFDIVTIGDMPIRDQISLFSDVSLLAGVHGAGLSNLAFTRTNARVLEIVSPARLWPTFRMAAARHGRTYHAVIGEGVVDAQTKSAGDGNEDFRCDTRWLELSISEIDRDAATWGPS